MQRFQQRQFSSKASPLRVLLTLAGLLLVVTLGFYCFLRFSHLTKSTRFSKTRATDLPYSKIGDSSPKTESVVIKTPSSNRDQFTLEVKACSSRAEAEELVENMASKNISAYYTPLQTEDGRVIYRVRLGLFPSYAMAEKISSQIRRDQNITNQIVKLQ